MEKPKIDNLIEAMQAFLLRNIRNGINKNPQEKLIRGMLILGMSHEDADNQTAFAISKQLLQADLKKLGIADMFDWTEDEN